MSADRTHLSVIATHLAIDKLVEELRAEVRENSFQMDGLLSSNHELKRKNEDLQAENGRLQAEVEGRLAAPAKRAPRKTRAPKPAEAPALSDPNAP